MSLRWKTAWVTGASSGIGRELALLLAAGGVKVAASARNAAALETLARERCGIVPVPVDVTDRDAIANAVRTIEEKIGPIDLAILNAGVWDPMTASALDAARMNAAMAVNFGGIANALEPLSARMIARRQGHLALVASVAGYRGLPKAAAYAPTKAAVISLAEVLRAELPRHGVDVSVVNPGFIETPMTAGNTFPMPFMLKADDAARRIVKGLDKRRFEIAFPWQLVSILKLMRLLPYRFYFPIISRTAGRNQS